MKNILPDDEEDLLKLMTRFLPKKYFLEDRDDDTVHAITRQQFLHVQDIIRKLYDTQEETGDSASPFDAAESAFETIVYERISDAGDYSADSDGLYVYSESPRSDLTILTPAQLLRVLKRWWGCNDFRQMELLTGYRCSDFDPKDGYQEFLDTCDDWWNNLSFADKLGTWREKR